MLDCVENFCYLGDEIGARGGAEEACRNRVKNAWMSFNKQGSILTTRGVSMRLKGKFYRMCVQRVMDTETGESGENDDKMDVRSDIEGQMQE